MNMGDPKGFALRSAEQMLAHRNSLALNADDVERAWQALRATADAVAKHTDEHADLARAATARWTGRAADGFDGRAGYVGKGLHLTAGAAADGAGIIDATRQELDARRRAVSQLIDEYVGKATPILDAANKISGAGAVGAVQAALAQVLPMRDHYTRESAKHLSAAYTQLKDAARRLRELERTVEHDGFADPGRKPRREAGIGKSQAKPSRSGRRPNRSETRGTIPPRSPQPGRRTPAQPQQPARPVQQQPAHRPSDDRGGEQRDRRPPQRPVYVPPADQYPGHGPGRSDAQQGYEGLGGGGPFDREFPRRPRIDQ